MQAPNYNLDEFVDQDILNDGSSKLMASIQEPLSGVVFFSPGVVNTNSCTFAYHSNLTVSVNAPSPFRCLFSSGVYSGAHGTVNGVDSSSTLVTFAGLVPVSGPPIVAYIVATADTVLLDPIPITGPPSGHPDFNTNFTPYVGYTRNQSTLNISTTLTPPDNLTTIELGRTTLSVGQTVVSTVSAGFRVTAYVIPPPLTGDVTGPFNNTYLSRIQGRNIVLQALSAGQVLQYNGTNWTNGTPSTLSTLGGDVTGPSNSNLITRIRTFPVVTNLTPNTPLFFTGAQWQTQLLPLIGGGTGATTAASARTNLQTGFVQHYQGFINGNINLVDGVYTTLGTISPVTMPLGGTWRVFASLKLTVQFAGGNSLPVGDQIVVAFEAYCSDNPPADNNSFAHFRGTTVTLSQPGRASDQIVAGGSGVSPLYSGGQTVAISIRAKSILIAGGLFITATALAAANSRLDLYVISSQS